MKKLNVIIADDEESALEVLSSLLLDTKKVNILKTISNPLTIESCIARLKTDAVFLDIQMPAYNGLDLLENLRTYRPALPVVYVSAHKKFAVEAAKLNPFSYLLKPVNRKELLATINHIIDFRGKLKKSEATNNKHIKLPIKNGMVFILPDEIISLMADGNYTIINLIKNKSYTSSYNLGKLFKKLPLGQFERINRSTVVNMNYLKEINRHEKYCMLIADNFTQKYPISSSFLASISKEK